MTPVEDTGFVADKEAAMQKSIKGGRARHLKSSVAIRSPLAIQASLPPPPDPKKVFVSSTQIDLTPYREATAQAITRVDWHPLRVCEQGTLHAGPVLKRCTEEVCRADLFVLLVGYRYGSVPEPKDGGYGGKSITMIEYDWWRAREKLCGKWPAVVFMAMNDDQQLPADESDEAGARQFLFRTTLAKETAVHAFRFFPLEHPEHAHSVQELSRLVREQLVHAKDRLAEQTRTQALRERAEAQRNIKSMQGHVESLQQQLSAMQAELTHLRNRQPVNAAALLALGGLIGVGLAKQ